MRKMGKAYHYEKTELLFIDSTKSVKLKRELKTNNSNTDSDGHVKDNYKR